MKTPAVIHPTRHAFRLSSVTVLMLGLGLIPAIASSLDDVSQPPPTDPSAYSNQPADPNPALLNLYTLPEANEGSLELTDGAYGDRTTVRKDNVLPPALQTSEKYPTNGKPSPLFGAQPFTQQLLLFEEFGPEKLDPSIPVPSLTFPVPTLGAAPAQDPNIVARSGPSGTALEAFLKQPGLYPFPTQYANVLDRNPWNTQIEMFPNRQPVGSPA